MGTVRAALRILAGGAVLLGASVALPALLLLRGQARQRAVRAVFRAMLAAFGVRLSVSEVDSFTTARGGRGALVVNNHISWLDIVAVNALRPMRALAKSEIASWPVVGRLAGAAGTVYLDRERLFTLPSSVAELTTTLRSGALVNVTPEGTTWCGLGAGEFRPAAFQAAIDGGVPVRPVALRYRIAGGPETAVPAFVGDETLISSLRRVARIRGLVLEVRVCPEIAPGRASDRRELAALAESSIDSALGRVRVWRRAPAGRIATGHPGSPGATRAGDTRDARTGEVRPAEADSGNVSTVSR